MLLFPQRLLYSICYSSSSAHVLPQNHICGAFARDLSQDLLNAELQCGRKQAHLKVAATIQVMSGKHVCTQVTQAKESEVGDRIRYLIEVLSINQESHMQV